MVRNWCNLVWVATSLVSIIQAGLVHLQGNAGAVLTTRTWTHADVCVCEELHGSRLTSWKWVDGVDTGTDESAQSLAL